MVCIVIPAFFRRLFPEQTIRAASYSLVDQAITSLMTFGVHVYVARLLGPEPFGYFVLAFTSILFLQMFHSSLVLEPTLVFAGKH